MKFRRYIFEKEKIIKMKTLFGLILILTLSQTIYPQVTEQWVQRFTSGGNRNESINDMFVDAAGNVYMTGSQKEEGFPYGYRIEGLTVKYNTQGVQQWIQNYTAPDTNGAYLRAIHVDAAGNVYVTGSCAIYSGGGNEMLVIKYDAGGTQLWSHRFNYSGNQATYGYDIITDLSGNVYVTGEFATNVITYNNIFLVKYGPSGNLINQTFYHWQSEGGRKIALDGNGKIIVGGYLNDNDTLSFIMLKYEQNLDFVVSARWGNNVGNINPISMVVDMNSNIIMAGTVNSSLDYGVVKFDNNGTYQWSKTYNSPEGWDKLRDLAKDRFGNIYVIGENGTAGFPASFKMTTIKYNSNGDEIWLRRYDTTTVSGFAGVSIAVDDSLNVYAIGNKNGGADYATIKYNSVGTLQWSKFYNGPSSSLDYPIAIGLDANGNTYVAGNSLDNTTGNDIALIKYVPSSIGIQNVSTELPDGFSLSQNYPNPFNPVTKIRFTIDGNATVRSNAKLKVYNSAGVEVATLLNGYLSAGTYEADFDGSGFSSGVYFYTLEYAGKSDTKKMILLK